MRFLCIICLALALSCVIAGAGVAQEEKAWYQDKPIRDIVFEGLEHVPASDLEGITKFYIGKAFTDDLYWELLGRLYALEYFDTITSTAVRWDYEGTQMILRFTVKEKPIVSKINVVGNSGLRRNEILDVITLKVNDVLTPLRLLQDEQAIKNKYLEKGFPNVEVQSQTKPGDKGSIIVDFIITEGQKITIEAFRFEFLGDEKPIFSERTLRRQLTLTEKGILRDGAFQEAKLIADRTALTQYYRDRGYIDAEVRDVALERRTDEKGAERLTIIFYIYQGRQYTFGGIIFDGNHIFSNEQLSALIFSKVGDTANDTRIQADLLRVADLYYENGYIFNTIDPEIVKNPEARTISYQVHIVERGRAHIENIRIRGNAKTKDYVILREIPLEVGDVFSKTKVMDGLRNLYNLQYFSLVAPETPPGSNENLMDLIFDVEEQPTTDIQFGLTFSGSADPDTFPISGMIRWNDRNFRGTGNILGAEINASPDTQSLSVEYTHRWLFGLPFSGSFDITASHSKRKGLMDNAPPFFNGTEDEEKYAFPDGFDSYTAYANDDDGLPSSEFLMPYNQWRLSIGMSSGYRWSTFLGNLSLGGGLRLGMIYTNYDSNVFRPFDPILRGEHNRWTPQTSLWTSLSLDQRDIYYDPSKGYYGIQRIGYYGIFSGEEEHYIRTDTKAEIFFTLWNLAVTDKWSFKGVFGLHSGLSFIFPQPFHARPEIESANKLAVDGMFIGRGWSSDYNNKGLALWENWAELRIPLAPGILSWDFFFDAAGVKKTPGDFFSSFFTQDDSNSFFLRFSFGAGLRFTLPQFPFRFSLAKRFRIRDGNLKWETGAIGGGSPGSGVDFVLSLAMSTY